MVDRSDPAISQDRLQLTDVPFDDFEIRAILKPFAQKAGEIRVALDHEDAAIRLDTLADDSGNRSRARAQLDQGPGLIPVDVPQRG